jgi:hypothetical protein
MGPNTDSESSAREFNACLREQPIGKEKLMRSAARILTALAMLLLVTVSVQAFEDATHEEKVVSVTAGQAGADAKLVATGDDGKEHTHMIPSAAKVTLDGKAAKITDLKKGDHVKVTLSAEKVTSVAATRAVAQ